MPILRLPALFLAFVLCIGCTESDAPAPVEAPPTQPVSLDDPIPTPTAETKAKFDALMAHAQAENLEARPLGEIMQVVAEQLLGTAYVAGQLDEPETETLLVSLEGFDCVLFVEAVLAAAQGIADGDYAYDTFARNVRALRYRDGQLTDYCSRLHYFSDWIADNERRGTVENLTPDLPGAVELDKDLTFMTKNREAYKQLAANDEYFAEMQRIEARLKDLDMYHVPQNAIRGTYDQLQAGDIIALTTSLEGLDVTHTGLVYEKPDGSKAFIHASTSGEVKISDDLQAYVEGNDLQIGMIVARPLADR